jgi:hypothetical protein
VPQARLKSPAENAGLPSGRRIRSFAAAWLGGPCGGRTRIYPCKMAKEDHLAAAGIASITDLQLGGLIPLQARDTDLLAGMIIHGKLPHLAMIVRVKEVFFHCGKSMIRSGTWEPDRWDPIDGLPTRQPFSRGGRMRRIALHRCDSATVGRRTITASFAFICYFRARAGV